ncbi:alpha/beta fold hydrolase [Mangrovitalea sediminis]|uniref:alpha/beta fold hydrolase n=1 Tax=Mangrovitalea sediminis TaxID=1982043 RepID=UPI000BE61AF7|nr:alpha/beta fold hydrolase [Mangrovitalea sediminis]
MRSSSQLFPVSLMAAETNGPFNEDVYELRPHNSADASVSVAVTRVTDPRAAPVGQSIVLLHGQFGNRRVWLTPDAQGLAARLAAAGYDVWLPEMRGHGLSPRNRRWENNTLSDIGRFDWPAVNAFVVEQTGHYPRWAALDIGALSLAYGMIEVSDFMAGVVGLGLVNPLRSPARAWDDRGGLSPIRSWRLRRKGYIDGYERRLGPEQEPLALYDELRHWRQLGRKEEHPVFDHLRRIREPTLVMTDHRLDREGDFGRRLVGLLGSRERWYRGFRTRSDAALMTTMGAASRVVSDVEDTLLTWILSGEPDDVTMKPRMESA